MLIWTPPPGHWLIMLATLVFAVVPVRDDTTGTWSFGVLKNPEQFFVVLGFGLLGLMLYRYLCGIWRQNSRFAQRMTAAVLVFACVFSMVHIGIGKFGQWHTDSDLVEQDTNALQLKNDLPEGDYRIDTYKIHDNIGCGWIKAACNTSAARRLPASSASTRGWGSSGMCAASRRSQTTPCAAF